VNTVEPIKDMNKVLDIADYLKSRKSQYAQRDYMLWMSGIYLGIRISDLLKLKARDIRDKDTIYIREIKTGKENYIEIPTEFKTELQSYVRNKKDYEFLFQSRETEKKKDNHGKLISLDKPLSRQQAYRIIRNAAQRFGIERTGTHTMRKTFGYFLYQRTKDIVLVKEILNHSDISVTRRYIGLTQDMKAGAVKAMSYRRK